MIEDLPQPEVVPADTQIKTEFITLEFDDAGTARVTIGTVKGYSDADGFHGNDRTREKAVCEGLSISPDAGPQEIVKTVKAELATRAAILDVPQPEKEKPLDRLDPQTENPERFDGGILRVTAPTGQRIQSGDAGSNLAQ